ncbi:LytR/AlgR family response regulator transcription factor [Pedobacter nutrimenti]|jgi:DNA-binding LytR/AlgR family response regulator|uniref:LytTR family two component transcriptional regulator n=1 Tax=Pedobacter nutrimenti TaxID=1241337 RepID=A0A318UE49_9SPHI|nr:LytTR family DNA-binding domain-containing protein [Pedobacter nutrimenti]PYF72786.1 LytTR family two component transcriptional regulator [Pedobacter nutrimenti]
MNILNKVLILEDEKPNSDRIKRLISEIRPDLEIVGVLTSIQKTINWLTENSCPDLIMMDIQLADGISFEIFHLAEVKCPVIFTTAYNEYAVQAFKYNSLDYLLKPVEKDELEAAFTKFENSTKTSGPQSSLIEELLSRIQTKEYRSRFFLPYRDGYRKINVQDIAFFSSQMTITYANLANGEKIVVPQTLETLEQELEPKNFFRVNRQYILHVNSIEKVHNFFNGKLKLTVKNCPDTEVIVSRTKAPLFKTWLDY